MTRRFVYRGRNTNEISFPLGGLGTGCVGLSGNGRLIDWEIAGRPDKGSQNFSHFAIRAEQNGEVLDARVLHGHLHPPYTGTLGAGYRGFGWGPDRETMAGAPHFRDVEFLGEFPIAELRFKGCSFPGQVKTIAFNPFIPMNDEDSGIPAAFFEIQVTNPTSKPIDYTVVGVLHNPLKSRNRHSFHRKNGLKMLHLASDGYGEKEFGAGDLTLATDAANVSAQRYWFRGAWFDNLEVYWRELTSPGRLNDRSYDGRYLENCTGMLAAHLTVEPKATGTVRYLIAWNYPWFEPYWERDRAAWQEEAEAKGLDFTWKQYYATIWKDSKDSARYALKNWDRLYADTRLFKDTLLASDLPEEALEAVSANLSIIKSPTILRLQDGTLYGFEGCHCNAGCCVGSCTHVWNYAQAIPYLFPALERSMREANYRYNQNPDGGMHFRIMLPLGVKLSRQRPCADGQFGDVMKTYREWKISGDTEWLRALWPAIKKSIEYAWHPNNQDQWDPAQTGVLHGRQHHTLDMELFGPNSWLTGYYLGALKAAAEMAEALDEPGTAGEYRELFARGKEWADTHLFNGEYYHQIIDLKDRSIAERFEALNYWNDEHRELKYQIAEGSEIDQVIAQWHANLYGLGEIFDPKQVKTALRSLYKYNFRPQMREYFNACRIYCVNDEGGLVISHWPEGTYRPMTPLPYAGETQNGYEWAACIQMIQAGLIKQGLRCVRAIRARYDGEKRNPWNEFECGNNYARSMATYSLLNAFSGFVYDMTRGMIGFQPLEPKRSSFRCFWSLSKAWGEVRITKTKITLRVLQGTLELKEYQSHAPVRKATLGKQAVELAQAGSVVRFRKPVTLGAGEELVLRGEQ